MAVNRLKYNSLNPPDEPMQDQTTHVVHEMPHTTQLQGVTIHYTGEPTITRWYTDGSKRHGQAGGEIYNGNNGAAFRVHGPQQVYRAETMACALVSDMARRGMK